MMRLARSPRRLRRAWAWGLSLTAVGMVGCSHGSRAAIPVALADGLYLRYTASITSEGTQVNDAYQYDFHAVEGGRWRVTETPGEYGTGQTLAMVIDAGGTVVQSNDELTQWQVGKRFNDLWLAPEERKAGTVVRPLDDACGYKVGEGTAWQRWQVIPAVCAGEATATRYYEAGTGWLVGSELTGREGKRLDVLGSTNASIPSQ